MKAHDPSVSDFTAFLRTLHGSIALDPECPHGGAVFRPSVNGRYLLCLPVENGHYVLVRHVVGSSKMIFPTISRDVASAETVFRMIHSAMKLVGFVEDVAVTIPKVA